MRATQAAEAAREAPMKIAYLVNQYPQPSQTFIRREIAALEASGWDVSRFAVRRWDQPLVDEADEAERRRTRYILGVGAFGLVLALLRNAVVRAGSLLGALALAVRVGRRSERGLLLHLIYLAEACVLRRWLERDGVRHLHAHFGTNSATVAMLCRRLGGPPYSFTVHGPEEFDMAGWIALGEKVRRAAFVVAISDFGRSQLYRWADYADWPKVRVVRCVGDDAFRTPTPPDPASTRRLVCVGRLVEQKGQLILLEAAASLRRRGLTFELALIGDGPMRGDLQRVIDENGLAPHVVILGWRDGREIRREILGARALVLPSFAEGLPVVIMEALALGRPVISTQVAAIPELVRPGVNGWLVPPGSVDALADAMAEAIEAPIETLWAMGRAGAEAVARMHDARTEAARLAALIGASARSAGLAAPPGAAAGQLEPGGAETDGDPS